MLRPVGSVSTAVYWRRRLLILAAVVLTGLTVYVVFVARDGGAAKNAGGPQRGGSGQHRTYHRSSSPLSADPVSCVPAVLRIRAITGQQRYRVGQQPDLEIQVSNTGQRPCQTDLSDQHIELVVLNGESRVWSSHDCQLKPGHAYLTLAAGKSVRRSIRWTGLSSQPHCAGSRQRVGVGIYTLQARLGVAEGTPAKFTITT